jgi:hypothetical protein
VAVFLLKILEYINRQIYSPAQATARDNLNLHGFQVFF